ncbi:hypothetical protein, partial [Akkermansia muciniphila]|uniref:hypothetical protein n=1 Tax=Akkermansia muciniphila TaxID=239935 RepID=UPI0019617BFE
SLRVGGVILTNAGHWLPFLTESAVGCREVKIAVDVAATFAYNNMVLKKRLVYAACLSLPLCWAGSSSGS